MDVTARSVWSDGWWVVTVPEVEGVVTQARRLDQVEQMTIDAVRTMLEDPTVEVAVTILQEPGTDDRLGALSAWAESDEALALAGDVLRGEDAARAGRDAVAQADAQHSPSQRRAR